MASLRSRLQVAAVLLLTVVPLTGCGKFFVDGTATTTALSSSATTSVADADLTLTATVAPSAATGTVDFFDGDTSIGIETLTTGTATLDANMLAAGTHTIIAVYSGDETYATSTSTALTITVTAAASS